MKQFRHSVLLLLGLITATTLMTVGGVNLRLHNNRYEGLVVVIGDDVEESSMLIDRIKEAFINASKLLFTATRRRAYFHEITIVVPPHWSVQNTTEAPLYMNEFKEHIRVGNGNRGNVTGPYVRGNMECGKPAWFMHLTPDFLYKEDPTPYGKHGIVIYKPAWFIHLTPDFLYKEDPTPYGKHANVIVHEWGHLRWGLFDEYPSVNAQPANTQELVPRKINFYQNGGKWVPVICSSRVRGAPCQGNCDKTQPCSKYLERDTGPPPDCQFCPFPNQTFKSGGSLMAQQWLNSMDNFCDVDTSDNPNIWHNSEATNMQNKMCNGKSAWEVMRQHEDFMNNNNPPMSDEPLFEEMIFNVIKRSGRKRVLVLDTSGSMQGSRITILNKAATFAIDNIIETDSWLGIVTFSNNPRVAAYMTYINNQTTRDILKSRIPSRTDGGTEIKIGLKTAVKILQDKFDSTNQTELILISDGESNSPYDDYFPVLVNKNVIVHTIAISNHADDKMAELAKLTGGGSYTFLETESVSMIDVLSQAISAGQTSNDKSEALFANSHKITRTLTDSFYIDDGLGNTTVIVVILNIDHDIRATLDVIGPDNATYSKTETTTILKLSIPGTIPAGQYEYSITLDTTAAVAADVSVTSNAITTTDDIIRVTSRLSNTTVDFNGDDELKLYVSVEKGGSPVLRATVTAVLAADSDVTPINITLQDNGAGPDVVSNDGIYSAFLIKKYFTGKRTTTFGQRVRYNAKVFITGDHLSFTFDITNGAAPMPGAVPEAVYHPKPVGAFQRQSFPREIVVVNLEPGTGPAQILDTTPPAQITDLLVTDIRNNKPDGEESFTYTLTWTAVGDDMDVGQAANYSIRLDKEIRNLRDHFNMSTPVPQNLTAPKPAGEEETFNITLTLQECNGTCYLAIRAADASGLESVTSNIVIIDVDFSYKSQEEVERTTTTSTTTLSSISSTSTTTTSTTTTPTPLPTSSDDKSKLGKIVAISVAAVGVLVGIAVVAYCLVRKRSRKYSREQKAPNTTSREMKAMEAGRR